MDRAQLSASPEEGPSRSAVHHPPSAACPFCFIGKAHRDLTTRPQLSGSCTHQAPHPQLAPDRQPRRPARREVGKTTHLQPMAGKTRRSVLFFCAAWGFRASQCAWQRRELTCFLIEPDFSDCSSRPAAQDGLGDATCGEAREKRSRWRRQEEPAAEPPTTEKKLHATPENPRKDKCFWKFHGKGGLAGFVPLAQSVTSGAAPPFGNPLTKSSAQIPCTRMGGMLGGGTWL